MDQKEKNMTRNETTALMARFICAKHDISSYTNLLYKYYGQQSRIKTSLIMQISL